MKRYFSGLRARLLLLVLFAVIPAFVLNIYKAIDDRRQAAAEATQDARDRVHLAAREHSRLIASTRQYLLSVSKLPEVKQPTSVEACHRTLAEVHSPFSYYRLIGLALANGNVYCRSLKIFTKVNITDRGYFQRAVQTRDFGIGDYQIGRATLKPSINFGQAVIGEDGKINSVVFAALDIDWLNKLIATHELPPNSSMEVIDTDGTILARYPNPETWVGKTIPNSDLIRAVLGNQEEEGGTAEIAGLDGIKRFYAFSPLHNSPSGQVYVSVGLSTDVAFAAANEGFKRSIIVLLIVATLGVLLAWTVGDKFVLRRIKALATAANRLAEGDLTARSGLPHGEKEEISQLAFVFDRMASGLQLMTIALQRVNRALKTLSACNRGMLGANDELTLLNDMCRTIVQVGGYRYAWIGYADHTEDRTIQAAAQYGQGGELDELPAELIDSTWTDGEQGRGLIAEAIRTVKPCISHNMAGASKTTAWAEAASKHGIASGAVFPLTVQGKVVGALMICAREADAFNSEERELLNEAAQDIAVGISMLRVRTEHDRILEHMAYFDELTGLPNRAQLEKSLRRAMLEADQHNGSLALAIVDINRLWEVNDALGFHHGDQILKEIGIRIRRLFNKDTLVARMRGDEFAVLLVGASVDKIKQAVQSILDKLREPLLINNVTLELGAVIGVSLYPKHGKQAVELIRHADVAMHQAKKSGKGYLIYAVEEDEDYAKRLSLVSELRRAIETNQLILYYQPKIDMRSGALCGMEALVRWNHPVRGLIPPDEFISLAEQSGLINPLTDWVVRNALLQSITWRKAGFNTPVAINLSARTLRDSEFMDRMRALFGELGAEPSWLEIEITEGAVMDDADRALDILTQLNEMGITLFIDDFGTGYSSLGYLKKLPVDAVKIDKSFVMDMLENLDSAAIVRSTIGLAHDLDLKVVAEGVESQEILEKLAGLGCDTAQGYHISKPLPPENFDGPAFMSQRTFIKRPRKKRKAG